MTIGQEIDKHEYLHNKRTQFGITIQDQHKMIRTLSESPRKVIKLILSYEKEKKQKNYKEMYPKEFVSRSPDI